MSADIWLEGVETTECCDPQQGPVINTANVWAGHEVNLTYNLTPMLREAGFPGWKALINAPCSESGGMLTRVAATLAADPDRFRLLNPANGWGCYEDALGAMQHLARLCAAHPEAHFGGWL